MKKQTRVQPRILTRNGEYVIVWWQKSTGMILSAEDVNMHSRATRNAIRAMVWVHARNLERQRLLMTNSL